MSELTVFFFVGLTGLSSFQFAGGDGLGAATEDRLKPKNEKLHFPTEIPRYHYNPPCHSCNHRSPNFHNDMHSPPGFPDNFPIHHDHEFPPGFKHSPEFHERNFRVRDGRKNEDEDRKSGFNNNSVKEIPLNFLENFDNMDVNDLLLNYVDGYQENVRTFSLADRFSGDDGQERNAGMIPAKAGCIPENVSVPLAASDDPTMLFIPKCTRIERCGGCCSHKLLACQPTQTETISLQVVKTQYIGAKKLKYIGKEVIPLERHLKCKCSCKIKAEHCLHNQQYRPNECGCVCMNTDEEKKCYRHTDIKFWDREACTCKCYSVLQCSTGSVFDHNECRCKTMPKRRYAKLETKRYLLEELLVMPLNRDYPD